MRLSFALATVALVSSIDADTLTTCGDDVNIEAFALYDRTLKDLDQLESLVTFARSNHFLGKGNSDSDDTTEDPSSASSTGLSTSSEAESSTSSAAESSTSSAAESSTSSAADSSSSSATESSTEATTSMASTASTKDTTPAPVTEKLIRIRRVEAADEDKSDTNITRSRAIGVASFASNDEESKECLKVEVAMPSSAEDVDPKDFPKGEEVGEDKMTDSLNAIGHLLSGGMNEKFDNHPTAKLIYLFTEELPQSYKKEANVTPELKADQEKNQTKYDTEVTQWPSEPLETQTACDAGFPKLDTIDQLLEQKNTTLIVVSSSKEWGPLVDLMKNARLMQVEDGKKRALADAEEDPIVGQMNNECQRALDRANGTDDDADSGKKFKWWHALIIVLGVAAVILIAALIYECSGRSRRHAHDSEERNHAPAPAHLNGPSASRPSTATTAGIGAGTTAAAGSAGSLAARNSGDLQSQQEAARKSAEETRNAIDEARRSGSGHLREGAKAGSLKEGAAITGPGATVGATTGSNAGATTGSSGLAGQSTTDAAPLAGAKGTTDSATAAPNVGTHQAGSAPDNVAPGGIAALKERFNAD